MTAFGAAREEGKQQEEHVKGSRHAFFRRRVRHQCVPQAERLYHKRFAAFTMVFETIPLLHLHGVLHGW